MFLGKRSGDVSKNYSALSGITIGMMDGITIGMMDGITIGMMDGKALGNAPRREERHRRRVA
jgi:hypothetical protein